MRSYASDPSGSRGRRHAEPEDPLRTTHQRDRDRIVHSTAFRRLVYKTQVFLNHEGDLFRTRLTHSLEVAQLGRSMARTLGLNEDLVEAIALAHDLGHTPFGHAGQDALNECLQSFAPEIGGFEHNLQSLRIVDSLEKRYPAFDGLNLSFETREGILKHCSQANARRLVAVDPESVAGRFLKRTSPSLEAQLCNLADQMAYNAHDLDDGIRAGLLEASQLEELPLLRQLRADALRDFPGLSGRRLLFEMLRRLLTQQVHDLISSTQNALADLGPASADEARSMPELVQMSPDAVEHGVQLKAFLNRHLYRHPQVVETTELAKQIVRDLFLAYRENPGMLNSDISAETPLDRQVADYVAGMTDRFALREHERITGRRLFN